MSARFECGDGAGLVGYVYEDGDPRERGEIAAHVATCQSCADEVGALAATREALSEWVPREVPLGFRVGAAPTLAPAVVLRPAHWWHSPLPAWAQVAAAVVLFGAGVGLGALRSTGPAPAPPATVATVSPASLSDLSALEARLRAELARRDAGAQRTTAASRDDDALLRQVRTLISDSERRLQQELTLRTAEVVKDVDAQRRGDLARIERTFGQMEGTTNVQVEQQRQLLNYLMRVSQRQGQ